MPSERRGLGGLSFGFYFEADIAARRDVDAKNVWPAADRAVLGVCLSGPARGVDQRFIFFAAGGAEVCDRYEIIH